MQKILNAILQIEHVNGALFINPDGSVACSRFSTPVSRPPEDFAWIGLIEQFSGFREADVTFTDLRLYLRLTDNGCLVALLEPYAVIAMIRLQCDVLLSTVKKSKSHGLRRFFKK
ncbi:uncharacterized protein Dvar_42390 [Desulfosarcina variabilis str. Montpellier]|uniref:hypothetical protein n=1 Tax=Desulfosarcina variabilis TaxID=2300 RepID=UPI003AFA3C9F